MFVEKIFVHILAKNFLKHNTNDVRNTNQIIARFALMSPTAISLHQNIPRVTVSCFHFIQVALKKL